MFYFSKSKYCDFRQCPKIPWLKKYKPEVYTEDAAREARFTAGNEVGDLAMGLFGDYVEVTSYRSDGSLDLGRMKALTKQYLAEGREVICEAAFDADGLYCAVDILKKNGDGYDVFEVKSSTSPDHAVYLTDTGYQTYVLGRCGVNVKRVCLVTLDNSYVREGELDLSRLFRVTDVTEAAFAERAVAAEYLGEAKKVMRSAEEPGIGVGEQCNEPYACAFFSYCTRELPSPSVFDLYGLSFKKKVALLKSGVRSFGDALGSGTKLGEICLRQIEFSLGRQDAHIDREHIAEFLKTLTYPLYFLDFETIQLPIPPYDGTRPYQQIPVQYSLHILKEDAPVEHREFLGRPEEDPRRALAERLVADIPEDVCVLAYNKSFECGRIRELADAFPDLAPHLLSVCDHIADLIDPFRKGYYYTGAMGGSFSIKSVLPALYPDDPSLDYHNLEEVHNGSEAMDLFPRLAGMGEEERKRAEAALLKYCELDTYAMVKVYEALKAFL